MASLPKTIRQSELAGRLVLLHNSMDEVGHVDVVWMHPPVHRVFGFICASGFLGRKKSAFNLPQLYAIGEDGLIVNSAPVPTDAQKVRQIESLVGYEVWSDSGEKVGNIVDYVFDTKTGAIQSYLFTPHVLGALTDGIYNLYPRQMLSYGDRRIRVKDQVLESPELYRPGLKQKIAQVSESVRESAEEEWRSLAEQALAFREQALEQWQTLTEQAKNRVVPLSDQAKDRAQSLRERAKEQGLGFVDRLREQTRAYTEQLRSEFDGSGSSDSASPAWPSQPAEGKWDEYQWNTQPQEGSDNSAYASPQGNWGEDEPNEWDDDEWDEADWDDDDWDSEEPASPAVTQPPISQQRSTSSVEEDEDEDDDEGWDTWDLDEPAPIPTPPVPPPSAMPDGLTEGDRADQESFSDVTGTVEEDKAPALDLSIAVKDGEPTPDVEAGARDLPETTIPAAEEDGESTLAIASDQPNSPLPTEPIPLEDLDDDDPWV